MTLDAHASAMHPAVIPRLLEAFDPRVLVPRLLRFFYWMHLLHLLVFAPYPVPWRLAKRVFGGDFVAFCVMHFSGKGMLFVGIVTRWWPRPWTRRDAEMRSLVELLLVIVFVLAPVLPHEPVEHWGHVAGHLAAPLLLHLAESAVHRCGSRRPPRRPCAAGLADHLQLRESGVAIVPASREHHASRLL